MPKQNNPGCGCCCTILSDTFARDDSTDVGGQWVEEAGAWAIVGNTLEATAASGVLKAADPHSEPYLRIEVQMRADTSGDIGRIILDYVDSNNYKIAEFKLGAGAYIRLITRAGGVNNTLDELSVTAAAGAWHSVAACIGPNENFTAEIGVSTLTATTPVSATSGYFGLGTGGTVAGSVLFKNFIAYNITRESCPDCNACFGLWCSAVSSPPKTFSITIPNIYTAKNCNNQADYNNQTFELPYDPWVTGFLTQCWWGKVRQFPGGCITSDVMTVQITNGPGGRFNMRVEVQIARAAGSNTVNWNLLDFKPCESPLSVPWLSTAGGGVGSPFTVAGVVPNIDVSW